MRRLIIIVKSFGGHQSQTTIRIKSSHDIVYEKSSEKKRLETLQKNYLDFLSIPS